MNTVYKVGIYDLDLQLICHKSFLAKSDADRYARTVRSQFLQNVGNIKVETVNGR
jgi:hypothetical protein